MPFPLVIVLAVIVAMFGYLFGFHDGSTHLTARPDPVDFNYAPRIMPDHGVGAERKSEWKL